MARRKLRNLDNRILKKVVSHGAEYGINGISTKKIAEEIGITEPTIYVHFHTRKNLLLAANEFALNNLKNFSDVDATLSGKWGQLLLSAKENKDDAIYAYFFRNENVTADYDALFAKFLDSNDSIKASIAEHFMFQAAKGSLDVNEENVSKTFGIISSL